MNDELIELNKKTVYNLITAKREITLKRINIANKLYVEEIDRLSVIRNINFITKMVFFFTSKISKTYKAWDSCIEVFNRTLELLNDFEQEIKNIDDEEVQLYSKVLLFLSEEDYYPEHLTTIGKS